MEDMPRHEPPVGPSFGIAIVVLLLALGGIYFLITANARFHRQPVQETVSV